jgi:hypothetical protein
VTEKDTLLWQLGATWSLAWLFLGDLTDAECLWEPGPGAWTVRLDDTDSWRADFEQPDPNPAPPTTIAWLTWHVGWWWSDIQGRAFGDGGLTHSDATWPGTADGARAQLARCYEQWRTNVEGLAETDLASDALAAGCGRLAGRPFGRVVAWVNMELMKNAAEIGSARRLYAATAVRG